MGRQHIEHHATTSADPATVYALLRDGATWPSWSPIDAFELERLGESEREGVGAVRVLRSGRVTAIPRRASARASASGRPLAIMIRASGSTHRSTIPSSIGSACGWPWSAIA